MMTRWVYGPARCEPLEVAAKAFGKELYVRMKVLYAGCPPRVTQEGINRNIQGETAVRALR